jgi:ParB family chromosome partitioning protein
MEIKKIAIGKIVANNWNPNIMSEKKFASLVSHIAKKGMVQPILVRPHKAVKRELNEFEKQVLDKVPSPEFEIIDGEHRFKAAKQAGLTEIDCVVIELDDAHAMMTTIAMNNIKGYMQDLPLAGIIDQLNKQGIDIQKLSEEMAYEEREIKNYLRLLEAPTDFSGMVEHPEDRPITLTFVVWPAQEKVISEALSKTGIDSKANALSVICKKFLEEGN